jgi:hypothetical protein
VISLDLTGINSTFKQRKWVKTGPDRKGVYGWLKDITKTRTKSCHILTLPMILLFEQARLFQSKGKDRYWTTVEADLDVLRPANLSQS